MSIVIPDLSGLSRGIETAGGALAGALQKRAENRLMQKQRGALDSALESTDLQTQQGQQEFLQKTTRAGIPTQEALGILDRAIKQQSASQQAFQMDDPKELSELFARLGVPKEQAEDYAALYGNLSQGGRTSFANMFIDRLQRGEFGRPQDMSLEDMAPGELQPGGPADVEAVEEGFVFPEFDLFEGLLAKEKVQREKELFNANAKDFGELSKKIKSLKDDSVRVGTLERYNDSGRLPEGLDKLNINWKNGDIRFPALANPETQAFVKTVNDFTVKAKETFGARVTNFELGAFMKRLPTLANSTEGRRQIIAQMQSMGDLDKLYYDSLKEVYDNYGLRGIDSQKAESVAEQLRGPKEEVLKQRVADSAQAQEVYQLSLGLPEGHVLIEFEGKRVAIPEAQLDLAISKGARAL